MEKTLDGFGRAWYNLKLRGYVDLSANFAMRFRRKTAVITELSTQEKVIGVKQSRKAIRDGRAKRVFLACDADPAITGPVAESCAAAGIPVEEGHTMAQLGQACRITVGAAVVAVL